MMKPTTTNNQENTEAILPSFFYAIASSESRPLTSWEELEKLRSKAFSTMIDLAEETFNIPVRKKSGTKQ